LGVYSAWETVPRALRGVPVSTTAEEVMEDGSGWFADPDVDGQERYFDGEEWTSETRLIESDIPPLHLPDHVPELQRALAAATADIDEVEARLGRLFDRAEGVDPEVAKARRGSGLRRRAEAAPVEASVELEAEAEAGEEVEDEPELQLVDDDVVASLEAEARQAREAAEARADAAAAGPPTVESLLGTDEELEPELEFVDDEDEDVDAVDEVDDELDEEYEDDEPEPELEVVDVEPVHVAEPVHDVFADDGEVYAEDEDEFDEDEDVVAVAEVDDDALTELDEALASEEPEKLKRGKRRRR
jgi:Protein of unknown function (DUF2510)